MRVQGTALAFCVLLGTIGGGSLAEAAPGQRDSAGTSNVSPQRQSAAAIRPRAQRPAIHRAQASRAAAVRVQAHRHLRHGLTFRSTGSIASGGISCVPYARMVSGLQITGDGGDWWHNASGLYARGQRPEPGSVFTFRRSGGMTRGHVAVVERVLGPRHILIDHANWAGPGIRRGSVMRNVHVIDVSENNDWSAVRVQVGHDAGSFGRTYATYGFIYNRPDNGGGTLFAGAPLRRSTSFEQVAEAPALMSAMAMTPQGLARHATRRR